MKHSELLHKINTGLIVKGFKVESLGNANEQAARQALLASFTGVVELSGQKYGIVPIVDQQQDCFKLYWDITAVIFAEGQYNRQVLSVEPFRKLLQSAIDNDVDLEEFLAEHKYEVFNGN